MCNSILKILAFLFLQFSPVSFPDSNEFGAIGGLKRGGFSSDLWSVEKLWKGVKSDEWRIFLSSKGYAAEVLEISKSSEIQ